jgi:pimeloyl-ACP methyl ester carboxylesterase
MKLAQKLTINYVRAKLNILALVSNRKAAKSAFKIFSTPSRKTKKNTPAIFERGEKLKFKLERFVVKGHRWNTGGVRKILILHGFESSSKNFDRYIHSFIQKNYEVLAFDAPAHGESSGRRIVLPQYIATMEAIHQLYGPIQRFVAHSFGGLALMHFLEKITHDANTKAVLIAPATETNSAIENMFRLLQLNADIRAEFDRLIEEKAGVPPSHYAIPRTLPLIKAELLWIHDEEDAITPYKDVLPVIKSKWPNITFLITNGLGHRKIYRDDKVAKAVIDFL